MKHALFVVGLFVASQASAQIVRVSVSTAGVEADGGSFFPSITANGRFVTFTSAASNLVAGDTNGVADVFLRDRDVDVDGVFDEPGAVATTRLSVGPGGTQADGPSTTPTITPDGRYVVFVSQAGNLVAGASGNGHAQVYRLERTSNAMVRVSTTPGGGAANAPSSSPAVSDDGNVVAFIAGAESGLVPAAGGGPHVYVRDIAQAATSIAPEPADWVAQLAPSRFIEELTLSGDGSKVGYLALIRVTLSQLLTPMVHTAVVADLASGTIAPVPVPAHTRFFALSASGTAVTFADSNPYLPGSGAIQRRVVAGGAAIPALPLPGGLGRATASPSGRYAFTANAWLHDFDYGASMSLGFVATAADFSADDRWLALDSGTSTLVAGDANGIEDVFVVDLADLLDADDDTMDDRWETLFSVTDPDADPDTDGRTNAQEEDAGTHPNGHVQRFLAEGATGAFFHTAIALANPSPTAAASAVLTFDRGGGTRVRHPIAIPAGRAATVDVGAVRGVEAADVSTTVESDILLGVERSMTWGGADGAIHGSHAETATTAPSATWFLAEGSTVLGFDLFYLMQNPQATATQATVRYLLPSGTVITRTYTLAPGSRTTIYVNQVPGLDETDVSGDITADAPIVVERAMYRSAPGQPFALGHDSMGVTAAATSWFLAEGATGSFFDLYVLIANPGATDATVQARYARPDGTTVTQTYTVRAHSRFSVYVDAIPGLEATAVATTLASTNTVPIVAERAMYWPGGFFDYYEGHSSAGSTITALEWVVAGAKSGGADNAQTFVLIANTENRAGEATITLLPDVASTAPPPPPAPFVMPLPANSRTTVPVAVDGRYGVRVTSTGASPVELVVESAVYRSAEGVVWSSGSNALATPVP
jgi:hypothetical protein